MPAEVLAALEKALDAFYATKKAQQERLEEMKRLEALASGKRTVESVQVCVCVQMRAERERERAEHNITVPYK